MCLYTNQQKPKVATKPITVYKILQKGNLSPYWYTRYRRGDTKISDFSSRTCSEEGYKLQIKAGLHSMKSRKIAEKVIGGNFDSSYKVVEMIIPKGSKYYLGNFEGEGASYASDKLYFPKLKENGNTAKD